MATGCAILAVCWNHHAGYQYLKGHDAAFCVDNFEDILPLLQKIVDNPPLFKNMREKHTNVENRTIVEKIFRNKLWTSFKRLLRTNHDEDNT